MKELDEKRDTPWRPDSIGDALEILDQALVENKDELEQLKRTIGTLAKNADARVRANPLAFIGGVAVGTFAVGYWLGRER